MARESAIKAIHETMFGLQGKLIFLQEQYSVYHDNYSAEAMELLGVAEAYNKAVSAAYETKEFDNLSDSELDEMVDLSRQVSQLYELGVDFSAADTVVVNDDSFWKIYLDTNKKISKVEYGTDKTKAQIINSDGMIGAVIEMVGTDYEGKGFAKKLLTAAKLETTEAANLELQNKMLDDGLFYINKEEGWVTKESYFARMTAKDFLTIQDYKDITVKAVYNDSKQELLFTYTAGGITNTLFKLKASNNQRKRDFPTRLGDNTFVEEDTMKTMPNDGTASVPYIPGKFPKGMWRITAFEPDGTQDYGYYKIRTNAWREVGAWEEYKNEKGRSEWRLKRDADGNIVKTKDAGLLLHGGGWSQSVLDNTRGSNAYTDTTHGCIRLENIDVLLIVEVLQEYLNTQGFITLEVQ